ncbi:hypothetical protein DEA8626_04189 [Defluviimonas aquaemixtae]|uniref:DUF4142 domain-containing protein n=1 Tax=Albidovulum aquaemixtae TaxID=1542388 RepID=A0A2R8BNX2_9RHOB|nr:hypothetical protein [Defluviimonas aquaemixtae]SPH25153.1 hypothetical protein DEA8626_04189 [Defluviimonas aquaemixtae]
MRTISFFICAMLGLAETAVAASDDPDWPCIQRRTGALSPGVMWPSPPNDAQAVGEAADLAAALALRRVAIEAAEARVAGYIAAHPDLTADDLGAIFLAAFARIDRDRKRVLDGIVRYARSQIALAEKIDAAHSEMSALEAAEEPDFDRMDALEAEIDWDERIYRDRERALTYVCETPVILEKRAYAIAQILLKHMPE